MPRFIFKYNFNTKHLIIGAFFGFGLLYGIIRYYPDGRLHMIFCDVGQGDAIYIRMPNNADILVDGGPDSKVLSCLGRYMPFYDRTIDVVILTHPQKDHLTGLVQVLGRYKVNYFMATTVSHTINEYQKLQKIIEEKAIKVRYLSSGKKIRFAEVLLVALWPDEEWLKKELQIDVYPADTTGKLVGWHTQSDLNIFSSYLHLRYKNLDLLLTGDGDSQVQELMEVGGLYDKIPDAIEILKVPHHGSKTGMSDAFIKKVKPKTSVIQVGKNSYGHPSHSIINALGKYGQVLRTDISKNIEIISDGNSLLVK